MPRKRDLSLFAVVVLSMLTGCVRREPPTGPAPQDSGARKQAAFHLEVSPPDRGYAILSVGLLRAAGNVSACGRIHSNVAIDRLGSALEAPGDCPDSLILTEGFTVIPPSVRTDPALYPKTTYYFVVPHPEPSLQRAWIVKSSPAGDLTLRTGIKASLVDSLAISRLGAFVNYSFQNPVAIAAMFDWDIGKCCLDRVGGDEHVIVNFGEYLLESPATFANVDLQDGPNRQTPLRSTIVNTRYRGLSLGRAALVDSSNWEGGGIALRQVSFRPTNGIAVIAQSIQVSGISDLEVGTTNEPAILYVTGSISGNWNLTGCLVGSTIVLGSVNRVSGNAEFRGDSGYEAVLPPFLGRFWHADPPFTAPRPTKAPAPK